MKSFGPFLMVIYVCIIYAKENRTGCDHLGVQFYEELLCDSKGVDAYDCPTHYICPNYTTSPRACSYQGVNYRVGEMVTNVTIPCVGDCYCHKYSALKYTQIRCIFINCVSFITNGCYAKYKLGGCCSIGEICPPFNNVTCEVNGRTYRDGEKFVPQDTCWECVCQKGFNGTYEEPYCTRTACGFELTHAGEIEKRCAPVYFLQHKNTEALCCPGRFICPEDVIDLKVINSGVSSNAEEEECTFGEQKFGLNGMFNLTYIEKSSRRNIICTCQLPPLPACKEVFY